MELSKKIKPIKDNITQRKKIVNDEEVDYLYGELGGHQYEQFYLQEQLLAIYNMKTIYLYSNFEILLKDMIVTALPNINKKDLYKWNTVESVLKDNEIPLKSIEEYQSINELRIINNNIKHSNIINTKNVKVPEFEKKENFDLDSMDSFYSRIKNKPVIFLADLAEKLIAYLFEFDEGRIYGIAEKYKERMDRASIEKLIAALSK